MPTGAQHLGGTFVINEHRTTIQDHVNPCTHCGKIQGYVLDGISGVVFSECVIRWPQDPGGEFSVDDIKKNLDIDVPELIELAVPEL